MSKFRLFSGGKTPRTLERCRSRAQAVALAEQDTHRLSDAELRQAVDVLKQRHRTGESLDALLPETFAIVREAAVRTLGERPRDEQIIGAAALHLGSVVELKTGEGKTLTAVLTACLHALAGHGVHVMTANDYLAARDAEWMEPVYRFLGFRSTLLTEGGRPPERQAMYTADVLYSTASGFAYDYLRDNMVHTQSDVVQRGRFSALVDEADLVMLDGGALVPQISGPGDVISERPQLAAIDVHAYLGLYTHLAGLTGVVAEGDAEAYQDLYGRECVLVPAHQPTRCVDHLPIAYRDDAGMLRAMRKTVGEKRAAGQPVLIGTASEEMARRISQVLAFDSIENDLLDAKNHELDAEVIARAGRPGAVTVLAGTAGRGTGIRLAEPAGPGLFVLVMGPLATRRQVLHLRERAGRGGHPGESAFYISYDDPHVRLPRPAASLNEFDTEGPILSRMLARGVAATTTKLSDAAIKRLTSSLRFSAVQEKQRTVVYMRRANVLRDGLTRDQFDGVIERVMRGLVLDARTGPQDVDRLSLALRKHYPCTISREMIAGGLSGDPSSKERAALVQAVVRDARTAAKAREAELGPDVAAELTRRVMLSAMDRLWRAQMRDLLDAEKEAGLHAANADAALAEYQRAATRLATAMWEEIDMQFVGYWFNLDVTVE